MTQNSPKMTQNGLKWPKNGPKWPEKWPKIAEMAQKLALAKKIAEIYLPYLPLFASLHMQLYKWSCDRIQWSHCFDCNFRNGVKFHVVGARIIKPLKIRKMISLEQRHKGTLKQKLRVPFCRSWLEETGFVWLIGSLALVIDQWSSVTPRVQLLRSPCHPSLGSSVDSIAVSVFVYWLTLSNIRRKSK